VTHDQIEAMTLADRIVVMKDGVIHQIGKPLEVYNKPNNMFVAGFIGSPSMNFIEAKIIGKHSDLYIDAENFQLSVTLGQKERLKEMVEKEVILGVRPEDLYLKIPELFRENEKKHKNIIRSKVEVIEPIGSEVLLTTSAGRHELVVMISPENIPQLGGEIELMLNMERIHLFHQSTGLRLF
jgi:multiple sugar transport system ATP-binding protein